MCFRWTLASHPAKLFLVPAALQLQSNPFQGELKEPTDIAPPHSKSKRKCYTTLLCTMQHQVVQCMHHCNRHALQPAWLAQLEDAVSCCLAVSLSCNSLKYAIPTAMLASWHLAKDPHINSSGRQTPATRSLQVCRPLQQTTGPCY